MAAINTRRSLGVFPAPVFSDTQVQAGQLRLIEGRDDRGNRHVLMLAGIRPQPWPSFARAKVRRSVPYAIWRDSLRDILRVVMADTGIVAYPKGTYLGLAMSFGARSAKEIGAQRATSILSFDYTNCFKAGEDALSGTLFPDDSMVRYHGPGHAVDTAADFICAHVWEGGPWQIEWAEYTVPEAPISTTATVITKESHPEVWARLQPPRNVPDAPR